MGVKSSKSKPQGDTFLVNKKKYDGLAVMVVITFFISLVAAALLIYLALASFQLNNELNSNPETAPSPQQRYYPVAVSGLSFGIALVIFALITVAISGRRRLEKTASLVVQNQPGSVTIPVQVQSQPIPLGLAQTEGFPSQI